MRLARNVSVTHTEHGAVLLDAGAGRYWQLNQTGAEVLTILLGGGTESAAARRIAADLTTEDRALADVRSLIGQLTDAKLVLA
jgi:hypothetical protein